MTLPESKESHGFNRGCMGFSHASGDPVDNETAVKTLRQAYEMGYDFFDTAEAYTGFFPDGSVSYNEELVGKALHDVRDKVVIATKMGVYHNADLSLTVDSRPETIRKSVEGSLKKLGTDYILLLFQIQTDKLAHCIVKDSGTKFITQDLYLYHRIVHDGKQVSVQRFIIRLRTLSGRYILIQHLHIKCSIISKTHRRISVYGHPHVPMQSLYEGSPHIVPPLFYLLRK